MKSYTGLEQSKKLAKFLPLDSADMRFCFSHNLGGRVIGHYPMIGREPSMGTVPCWSLVALLDVFPNSEQKSVDICHGGWKGEEYVSDWFCSYDDYEKNYFETTNSGNPIDACYEMIIKLHEKNLL